MLFLVFSLLIPIAYGGSKCPDRSEIYPCICINKPIGKTKFETTLVCRALDSGSSLLAVETALADMQINKFLLYDSFWSKDMRSQQTDSLIAENIISSFRMEEIEVVDTKMTYFGCPETSNCRVNYVKRFTSINTTMSEKASCELKINSFVACPAHIEELVINGSFTSDTYLKPEFFPEPLTKLKVLHLPHNFITRIDKRTFTNAKFPVLHTLDLSNNLLRDAQHLFSSPLQLKYLDLSFNSIRSLVDFQYLPHLETLKLANNHLVQLLENEWLILPAKLRQIDLTNNNIDCSCSIRWVNSTFHINTNLMGTCRSPPEVATKKLRKASRFLIERCDEDGNIGHRIRHPH